MERKALTLPTLSSARNASVVVAVRDRGEVYVAEPVGGVLPSVV